MDHRLTPWVSTMVALLVVAFILPCATVFLVPRLMDTTGATGKARYRKFRRWVNFASVFILLIIMSLLNTLNAYLDNEDGFKEHPIHQRYKITAGIDFAASIILLFLSIVQLRIQEYNTWTGVGAILSANVCGIKLLAFSLALTGIEEIHVYSMDASFLLAFAASLPVLEQMAGANFRGD